MNSGMTRNGETSKVQVIEAMRGAAAIAVALFHIAGQLDGAVAAVLRQFGWLGVDVFFVISGFVVPLSLSGRDYTLRDFPRFLLRRLARLEPPYIASIVLVIALWQLSSMFPGFAGQVPAISLEQIAAHLFYLVPLTSQTWLSPVYWSLAYEFAFYILVGILFVPLMSRPVTWTAGMAASIGAAG